MEGYRSFSSTVIGEQHIKENKVCQDASAHYSDELVEIVIVADGHGSADYFRSDIGAQTAVAVALDILKDNAHRLAAQDADWMDRFKNDHEQQAALMSEIKEHIFYQWRERVRAHHDLNEFTEEDLNGISQKYVKRYLEQNIFNWAYGTTLIAAVVLKDLWFAVQLGDGNCIEYYPGKGFVESMPKDPFCVGESTTSLCQEDALQSFRHYMSSEIPHLLFVHSDGIDDSILSDEQRFDTYRVIGASFKNGYDYAEENVCKNVLPHIAKNWKKDDTSLAAIVNLEGIEKEAEEIYKERMTLRKHMDYQNACRKKAELERTSANVQATLAKYQKLQADMKAEFDRLSQRAMQLKADGKKNAELIEAQKKVLDKQLQELEQCKSIIEAYEGQTQNAASAAQIQEGQKVVGSKPGLEEALQELAEAPAPVETAVSEEAAQESVEPAKEAETAPEEQPAELHKPAENELLTEQSAKPQNEEVPEPPKTGLKALFGKGKQ